MLDERTGNDGQIDLRGRPDDDRRDVPGHFHIARVVAQRQDEHDDGCDADEHAEQEHGHDAETLRERQLQLLHFDDGEREDGDVDQEMREYGAEEEIAVVDGAVSWRLRAPELGYGNAVEDGEEGLSSTLVPNVVSYPSSRQTYAQDKPDNRTCG